MPKSVAIGDYSVGPGEAVFIVAEAGVNHNGDIELAKRLIEAAAEAGADAVKFQTFVAESVVLTEAPKAAYQLETTDRGESQLEMIKRLELPAGAFRELQRHCAERGILFLSSPFDEKSADLLAELDVPAFKVPSGEITNWPFLEHIAGKGKPVILSTGMSDLEEVRGAVKALRGVGNEQIVLLHCVSNYPADPADANLLAMHTMAQEFNVPVGYSDHALGSEVSLAAVALGACVIEKHFTLDMGLPGPDHRASLEPDELKALIEGIRIVESAMGDGVKSPRPSEKDTRRAARKSLVTARDIAEGEVIQADMLRALRPGTGIGPNEIREIIGKKAARLLKAGTVLGRKDLK